MEQIAKDWTRLTHLDPGVQNAIIIVLTAAVILIALAAWLFPDFRSIVVSATTSPFRLIWRAFHRPEAVEGSLIGGIRPNLAFSVSAHPSGRKNKVGVALFQDRVYLMPIYVKIKGREPGAYILQLRFRNYCSPAGFNAASTAQREGDQLVLEREHQVYRVLQTVPRQDGRSQLLGHVAVMPYTDQNGQQITPERITIPYNIRVGSFIYPRNYLDSFDVILRRE